MAKFLSPIPEKPISLIDRLKMAIGLIPDPYESSPKFISPLTASMLEPSPSPTPSPEPDYLNMIEKGFEKYGSPPIATLSAKFAEAPKRYRVFKKYPALLPAISIIETSGGKNITYQNNPMNWGIKVGFMPRNWGEAIEKAMTGIGERMPYYKKFRETLDLQDFVDVYAPSFENENYLDKLRQAMSYFE